jgi:hypothetical protein
MKDKLMLEQKSEIDGKAYRLCQRQVLATLLKAEITIVSEPQMPKWILTCTCKTTPSSQHY